MKVLWLLFFLAAWVAWKIITRKPGQLHKAQTRKRGTNTAAQRQHIRPLPPASYPVMTLEMIDSGDRPIDAATAVKLYRQFMLQTGYLDKQELAYHAGHFAQEMKDHRQGLAEDVAHEKDRWSEPVVRLQAEIAELKKAKAAIKDEAQRSQLNEDIKNLQEEIAEHRDDTEYLNTAQSALKDFRDDKRQFLVAYVNQQIHGHDHQHT